MERIREIKIVVEVDTNKDTYKTSLYMHDDESTEDFIKRVKNVLEETLNDIN